MNWAAVAILAFVTLQRLVELRLSRANVRRLIARGAIEYAPGHYPYLVALHVSWLAALWWRAPFRSVDIPLLLLFALLQLGRIWVLRTLGPRWTTRIIIVPGEKLVAGGPYRFVKHPNYLIVAGEIAVLPLVFGLWRIALIFSLVNALILAIRIRAENRALSR
jgi:methyltransferase